MFPRNSLIVSFFKDIQKFSHRHTSKIAVEVNSDVLQKLENIELKPRRHPGICKPIQNPSVPKNFIDGMLRSIGDYPVKTLLKESIELGQYLTARHPPAEAFYIKEKKTEIEKELDVKYPPPDPSTSTLEVLEHYRKVRQSRVNAILKQRVFAWKPMSYGHYEALLYAVGRGAQEYATLLSIFSEISKRSPDFTPRSFFDFGSGIGTGMWAASQLWKDTIFEYFNVDTSRDMNDLSEMILREGKDNYPACLRNVFYRQFLPATDTKYDLVLSAFSLFELPSATSRLETVQNLWQKTDQYLVIVEQGTRFGFELINEARDFILNLNYENTSGYVFSPCPHDFSCPRIAEDRTPCNFEAKFEHLPIGPNFSTEKLKTLYSYVVIKKGARDESNENSNWPRIVRPTIVRSKHSICRMCTSHGKLQEIIFTASKHGKFAYRCARSSNWGDRLPIKIGPLLNDKNVIK